MIITEQQYNSVVNGLRTQLELLRDKSRQDAKEAAIRDECSKIDRALITQLRGKVEDLELELTACIAVGSRCEASNVILKEMVATQERALSQAKGRLASKEKAAAKKK